MESSSFAKKVLLLLIILTLLILVAFFVMNKDKLEDDINEAEVITSMNVDTYDEDLYVYKMDEDTIYASEYFYNTYYLNNNDVTYEELEITENSKYYLKTLSNTATDINNIMISYDPITKDEFEFLLNNYNLLKIYVWLDDNDTCKNVLLYSSNNMQLEVSGLVK